ncbi:MAG: hypothetical protein K1X83_13840 [Oligoflexia bacterium]|nr:hypothetical protein [Oligoflexia bacterium]
MKRCTFISLTLAVLWPCWGIAQSRTNILDPLEDPRGKPELTICSQNLNNYGLMNDVRGRLPGFSESDLARKEQALISRFVSQGCDVIALQELLTKNEEGGSAALARLAGLLRRSTNRIFDYRAGSSHDPLSRVGFLVAADRASILNVVSFDNVELPKLSDKQKPRDFSRGPLELQLGVKGRDGSSSKTVTLINLHFKSKRGAKDDPTQLEWETWRMEMAEAVRRLYETRHARALTRGDTILVVLGDRNSNFDTASAQILEGALTLKNFKEQGPCRLSKRGVPLCQAGALRPQKLFSVLRLDPETRQQHGTFKLDDIYSWLDDILMPAESLRYAWMHYDREGDFDSGVLYGETVASDHAMVWTRLNW